MAKGTKGKRNRNRYPRAQARSRARRQRRGGSMPWNVTIVVILLVGVLFVYLAKQATSADNTPPRVNKDHWHAYLGIDVCGTWLPPAPSFEAAEGIHSHGEGLMHIHPFESVAAGKKATVGRFLADNQAANWSLSSDSMTLWDGQEHRNGQKCAGGTNDGRPARIVWSVGHFRQPWTGTLRTGNPSGFRPKDGDIVAVGFLPAGQPLPEPPGAEAALAHISDVGGAPASPGPATAPSSSVPTSSAPPGTSGP